MFLNFLSEPYILTFSYKKKMQYSKILKILGGCQGGKHITDVTNASRTMLMNIETLCWDPVLLNFFELPMKILPEIKSSSEV